LLLDISTS